MISAFARYPPSLGDKGGCCICARQRPDAIIKAWGAQPAALDVLAHGCKLAQSKWGARIPGGISPAVGKFQTVALKQLINHRGMGRSAWLGQFAFGFPIAGQLS